MTDHTASELLSLLTALDGYCHFDETGCECTEERAELKARARAICAAACAAADGHDEQIEFLVTVACIKPNGPDDAEDEDVPEITSVFIPAGTPLAFAREAATRFAMPQTVYLDEASGDWMHTNPFAPTLHRNPKHAVTMLNPNYFC